jgi:DNA-binding NarL/FixJ family response regulator
VPLFDLEALPELLNRVTSPSDGSGPGLATPVGFQALISLTTSERRVLFYLTEGRTAQDIADHLVLAVTTVRFHIRSILRKLGVRSQLAAVALATGRTFASP